MLRREAGDKAKAKAYLPKEKQYLVTRNGDSFLSWLTEDAQAYHTRLIAKMSEWLQCKRLCRNDFK